MASKKAYIALAGSLILLAGACFSYWWFTRPKADPDLKKIYNWVASIHAYQEEELTTAAVDSRVLTIDGVYRVDEPHSLFAFTSTTTTRIAGAKKPIIFTLDDMSIKKDVYTRVEMLQTYGPQLSVPSGDVWRHFKSTNIPKAYANIAIAGPLVDNLKLFGNGGAYVTLVKKWGEAPIKKEDLKRYSFVLSPRASPKLGGTLGPLVQRITTSGQIDIWVDSMSRIKYMHFKNTNYDATTTLSHFNETLSLTPPLHAQ